MLTQSSFDFSENRKITDEAISLAVDGADEVVPNWSGRCYRELVKYVEMVDDFITEDFRLYCESINFPIPTEARAFGGIIQKASRDKLIVPTGEFREMKSKNCHLNPKRVWRKN